jgi:hypothetical protein
LLIAHFVSIYDSVLRLINTSLTNLEFLYSTKDSD